MGKKSKLLYDLSRTIGKIASIVNDIETFLTFNPKKIGKRLINKATGKAFYKIRKKTIVK